MSLAYPTDTVSFRPKPGYMRSMDVWSVKRIVDWMAKDLAGRGIESARVDAELLLASALDVRRMDLYLQLDRPLEPSELDRTRALFKRRRTFEPIAYILGYRDFYKSRFQVGPSVLIPRPDSELLVERALAAGEGQQSLRVADLCTGSGCVGLSIARERSEKGLGTELWLTDISADALAVARSNGAELNVEARFVEGDLFAPIDGQRFDVITINPPYISESELASLMPDVREHEPHLALVGGADGRSVLRQIVRDAANFLAPRGTLLVEVGAGQARGFAQALCARGYQTLRIHRDLGAIERTIEARIEPPPAGSDETWIDEDDSPCMGTIEESHVLLDPDLSREINDDDVRGERRVEFDEASISAENTPE